jgi:hypothetical protein
MFSATICEQQHLDKELWDACYEEVLREKKRSLCRQGSVLDFFKSSSETPASPPVLLDIGNDDPYDTSGGSASCLNCHMCNRFYIPCKGPVAQLV